MGYDYSLGFLGRHQELVRKLVEVAKTGVVLTYTSETWEPIRQRHQLVRSVLANMSVNMKEYADIRKTIRTWTEHTDDGFRLMVGAPSHKVTGRPPGAPSDGWKQNYVPVNAAGDTFFFPSTIEDPDSDEYLALAGELTEKLNKTVRRVQARFKGATNDPAVIQYFSNLFTGWRCCAIGDNGLVTFERTT